MNKYFKIILKQLLKFFPFVLCITLILFVGLGVIFGEMMRLESESEENQIFRVGITGDTDNRYFALGKAALETFDSSRFSIKIDVMEENKAEKALQNGDIAAYVVIPENFIEEALYGTIKPLKYVSSAGSVGVVSMFKDEITLAIEELLIQSQKGVYGLDGTLKNNGFNKTGKYLDELNIEYVELIINRSNMYQLNEMGVSDGLSLFESILFGVIILFLMLICLPYGMVFIRSDRSINKMLSAKKFSPFKQIVSEYIAYFFVNIFVVAIVFAVAILVLSFIGSAGITDLIFGADIIKFIFSVILAVAMITAFSIMIFEFARDIISGVLMYFFLSLSLCYISGCIYPIYTFPSIIQKISGFLPMGIARGVLADSVLSSGSLIDFVWLLCYTFGFIFIAACVRKTKICEKG